MDIPVIKIGNSKGIRLSKLILDRYEIKDKVELIMEYDRLIIKPKPDPREGWDVAFEKAAIYDEEEMLIDDVFEDEEFEEWK